MIKFLKIFTFSLAILLNLIPISIIAEENKNINFSPVNSLKLLNYKKKYDLIWIDGAHGYPVVCIDIINSLHILKENGLILCDDVYLKLNQSNSHIFYQKYYKFFGTK